MIKIINKNSIKNLKLSETARHEAGHVVAAIALGFEPKFVKVYKNNHGNTAIWEPEFSYNDLAWCLIGCAGSVAENVEWINENDFAPVKNCGYTQADLPQLFSLTKKFLANYQPHLERITSALIKNRRLSGTEAKRIFLDNELKEVI